MNVLIWLYNNATHFLFFFTDTSLVQPALKVKCECQHSQSKLFPFKFYEICQIRRY